MKKRFKSKYQFADVKDLLTPNQLSRVLGISTPKLKKVAESAGSYYDPYTEIKENGKTRDIDKPTGEIKELQKKITDRILKHYPLSNVAYGGVKGKSIRDNAENHTNQPVVVRIDLSNCFHSVRAEWVYRCFRKQFGYSHAVSKLLTQLSTFNGSIPVGSPLSSMLVNVVLDQLWIEANEIAKSVGCKLTVWVDDVVISGKNAEQAIEPVKKLINRHCLKIGWHKLDIMRNNDLQEATGCSLNSGVGVPKAKRLAYARKAVEAAGNKQVDMTGQISYLTYVKPSQGKQLSKLVDKLNFTQKTN